LISFIDSHPAGRALDLGCGTGTNVITLARHGWQVTGVDFAATAVRLARKKISREGLQADIHLGDVSKLDILTETFDLILDIGCLHSLSYPERLSTLEHIQRLLDPNGTFLSYCFINPGSDDSRPGLSEEDIFLISTKFILTQRLNGADRHGQRPSTWLTIHSRV